MAATTIDRWAGRRDGGETAMGDVLSLLQRPVYTCPQVDRLLRLTKGTADRWLNGYTRKGAFYPPILRPEPQPTRWVTWGEFVETRLFAGYRDVDQIPAQRMRKVVDVLRERFDRKYPLAYAAPYLRPEGRRMLWEAQRVAGFPRDEFAVEVTTGQFILSPWVSGFVAATDLSGDHAESYTVAAGSAVSWIRPDLELPAVRLDPSLRGGEPVVDGRNVRVATLAGLVRAGEDPAEVAEWYELTVDDVRQAVTYDQRYARIA